MSPVRSQPSARDGAGRFVRPVPIALHHLRPAHPQLAGLARPADLAVYRDRRCAPRRLATGRPIEPARRSPNTGLACVQRGGLAQTIALDQPPAGDLAELDLDLHRQRCSRAEACLDRAEVVFLDVRVIDETAVHRRARPGRSSTFPVERRHDIVDRAAGWEQSSMSAQRKTPHSITTVMP